MERKSRAELNSLAAASVLLGAFSVLTCWTLVLPVAASPLAFIFALLSRGRRKLNAAAAAGLILGVTGLICSMFLSSVTIRWLLQIPESSGIMDLFRNRLDQLLFRFIPGGLLK